MSALFDPISLAWLILAAICGWLFFKRKWRPALVLTAFLVAAVISQIICLPERLVASLERPYYGMRFDALPPADAVVVCGGALQPSPNDFAGADFGDLVDRVLMGVELVRQKKGRTLVLGGSSGGPDVPLEADLEKRWLYAWGLATFPILDLGVCTNTRDEAVKALALAQQQNWKRVILVTSASHMNRAAAVFRKTGLDVIPVACDFKGSSSLALRKRGQLLFLPDANAVSHLANYMHEVIGMWYYSVRGWV